MSLVSFTVLLIISLIDGGQYYGEKKASTTRCRLQTSVDLWQVLVDRARGLERGLPQIKADVENIRINQCTLSQHSGVTRSNVQVEYAIVISIIVETFGGGVNGFQSDGAYECQNKGFQTSDEEFLSECIILRIMPPKKICKSRYMSSMQAIAERQRKTYFSCEFLYTTLKCQLFLSGKRFSDSRPWKIPDALPTNPILHMTSTLCQACVILEITLPYTGKTL